MIPIDFGSFDAITFDTYGTLIDWETGILAAFRPSVRARRIVVSDDDVLERYGRHEAALEAGAYVPYADVLGRAFAGVCAELGFSPDAGEVAAFSASVGDWPAFEDSAAALAALQRRFRLGVITNCDDALFALSNARLGVEFDWVVTAEQAGSYKPSRRNFDLALTRIGLPRERILHVAQSLFHDHVPAKALGMTTVWVDRRGGRGLGATPPAQAVPDLVVPDLATLAELAGVR
ncbi:MAG: 2-haloacid dehalogenase [Solirubrobacteraceae bacterium]|nr:2-haloacid dehalogenase [Solirubrobacteraceae bacterium]